MNRSFSMALMQPPPPGTKRTSHDLMTVRSSRFEKVRSAVTGSPPKEATRTFRSGVRERNWCGPVKSSWVTPLYSLGLETVAACLDEAVLDTLIVIGGRIDPLLSASTLSHIVDASNRCRRVASVCTGAFTLAAAGLLDGRRATTHWRYAARLQRDYPSIRVEADRIYCRDENIWTSAGITAGIDLSLALIEEDHGFDIAKGVAQHLVVYHRRHGGQSQFAASVDLAPKNKRI